MYYPSRTWHALGFVAAMMMAICGASAHAQMQRPIPDDAKRGVIQYLGGMMVTINESPTRLAPGANIRGQNNFIIVPSALPQGGALADYTVDSTGQVFRVWLLTAEEAARPKKIPAP